MIQLCHQIIHYDLGRTYYKMSISEKIKAIEQNKAQYNLDRQTAKIFALSSSGNVSKYEFLTGKDVLPEAALKRFEYSPFGKELKKQTSVAKKQYQDCDKVFNHDKKEEPVKIKKEGPLTTDESSLFYNMVYAEMALLKLHVLDNFFC